MRGVCVLTGTGDSDEHNGLRHGNLKAPPATVAGQHVVYANHVISGLLKPSPILLVRAARWSVFLRAFQPTHLILTTFATMRTAECRLLQLLLLIKEILFVHRLGFGLLVFVRYLILAACSCHLTMPRSTREGNENCRCRCRDRRSSENLSHNDRPD